MISDSGMRPIFVRRLLRVVFSKWSIKYESTDKFYCLFTVFYDLR